jgi:hypothetical protein
MKRLGGTLGDTVAVRKESVSKRLEDFFDPEDFNVRVKLHLAKSDQGTTTHTTLSRFLKAAAKDDEW